MSKKKKVVENETNNTRTEIEEKNTDEEFKEIEKIRNQTNAKIKDNSSTVFRLVGLSNGISLQDLS